MSPAQIMLIRHLSGLFAALEAFMHEVKPQLEQLKQDIEHAKHL